MKIKHIISGISPLACIVGLNCIAINPAHAAILNFVYEFESNETLSGSFEGDILADGNTVENLSNLNATYSGAPSVTFDTLSDGNFFTLDRSEFQLTASSSTGATFNAIRGLPGGVLVENIDVFVSSTNNDSDSTIGLDRFEVQVGGGPSPETTPEPGITLALAFLFSLGCWQKLNQKQIPS